MKDVREHFKNMRFDKNFHLGMGDIRLPISDQEDICDMVEQLQKKLEIAKSHLTITGLYAYNIQTKQNDERDCNKI